MTHHDTYRVHITVGAHDWDLVEDPAAGTVTDQLTVLTGLRFGWANTGLLWPVQPDAMSAALVLNVPDFPDVADVLRGDPVAIEIALCYDLDEGDELTQTIIASFYGRVSDATAAPRPGRDGVFLSVVAVDYTVDINEHDTVTSLGVPPTAMDALEVLNIFAFAAVGGDLPPTVWPFPDDVLVFPPTGETTARPVIDQILLQSVERFDHYRMVLAPIVDPDTRTLPAGDTRRFTLDKVQLTDRATTDPLLTIDAAHVERDVAWKQNRGTALTQLTVDGGRDYSTGDPTVPSPYVVTRGSPPYVAGNITVTTADHSAGFEVEGVGDFYIGDPLDDDPWQLGAIRLRPHLMTTEQRAAFPPVLFPRWTLDETDADRAACYTALVRVEGIATSPYADLEHVEGYLASADVEITGGRVLFTLSLRRCRHTEDT